MLRSQLEGLLIPTVLLPALIIGWWWIIPMAAVVWPFLVGDACENWGCRLAAAGLAAVNATAGVLVHQILRRAWSAFRDPGRST